MKKNIIINSKDRLHGTTSDFTIKFNLRQFYNCDFYYICSLVMPSSYYNVNNNNNTFLFLHPGIGLNQTNIIVTPGNYTPSELVSFIQTELNNIAAATWSISYNTITAKFTISTTAAASFGFYASNNLLSQLMGYSNTLYPANVNAKESINVADLSGTKYLHIKSNALSYKYSYEIISSNIDFRDVILSVPIDVNSYDMINYKNFDDINNKRPFDKLFPNVIDIKILDDNNNVIDLNGCDWSFEIVAWFTDNMTY